MTIINSDEMFKQWIKNNEVIRNKFYGEDFNLNKAVYSYSGPKICDYKFNFQVEGNRCHGCNTLSFLFKDGDIVYDKPFPILSGQYKNFCIQVSKHNKYSNDPKDFGKYETISINKELILSKIPQNNEFLNIFTGIYDNTINIVNKDAEIYHYVIVSVILNKLCTMGGNNRFLNVYVCDNINVVRSSPFYGVGTFSKILEKEKTLNIEIVQGIFFQIVFFYIFLKSKKCYFSHGSPDFKCLSFSGSKYSADIGTFKLTSPYKLYIDPGKYTSLVYERDQKPPIHILPQYEENMELQPINLCIYYEDNKDEPLNNREYISNPCLSEYSKKRKFCYILNSDIIFMIRNNGFYFPSLDIYLFLACLLLEKEFYSVFVLELKCNKILETMFKDQKDLFLKEIEKHHGSPQKNSDEIMAIFKSLKIKIRCSALTEIWEIIRK